MRMPKPISEYEIDWERARSHLDDRGFALIPAVLPKKSCEEIAAYYADDAMLLARVSINTSSIRCPG